MREVPDGGAVSGVTAPDPAARGEHGRAPPERYAASAVPAFHPSARGTMTRTQPPP